MTQILVIGVGNEMRGDDAAGLLVARCIAAKRLPGIQVRESRGDAADLIDAWRGADRVYVIDCCAPLGEPGRVRRFDARAAALPETVKTISSHSVNLGMAIEIARVLDALPPALSVFAIEGSSFEQGAAPSLQIAKAVGTVTFAVANEIRRTMSAIPGIIPS